MVIMMTDRPLMMDFSSTMMMMMMTMINECQLCDIIMLMRMTRVFIGGKLYTIASRGTFQSHVLNVILFIVLAIIFLDRFLLIRI